METQKNYVERLLPRNQLTSHFNQRDLTMLACGLLLGSGTFRKRLVELAESMPGTASEDWQVAFAIAKEQWSTAKFVELKLGREEPKSGLAPDARVMRAFVRGEVERRLRVVEFVASHYRRFLPHDAAEKRKLRGELEDLLASLQEDD